MNLVQKINGNQKTFKKQKHYVVKRCWKKGRPDLVFDVHKQK